MESREEVGIMKHIILFYDAAYMYLKTEVGHIFA